MRVVGALQPAAAGNRLCGVGLREAQIPFVDVEASSSSAKANMPHLVPFLAQILVPFLDLSHLLWKHDRHDSSLDAFVLLLQHTPT